MSCTHFRCVPHRFKTHPTQVSDASHTSSGCVLHLFWMSQESNKKGHGTYIHLALALLQSFVLAWTCIVHIPDTSCMRPRCVLHTFQTCLACVSEACRHYLGVELYCTHLTCKFHFLGLHSTFPCVLIRTLLIRILARVHNIVGGKSVI